MQADLRLVPGAIAAWLGTWWACGSEARQVWLVVLVLGLLAGWVVGWGRRSVWVGAAALPLVVTGVLLLGVQLRLSARAGDPVTALAREHRFATVTGVLLGDPQRLTSGAPSLPPRYLSVLLVSRVGTLAGERPSRGRLVVFGSPAWAQHTAGQSVRVRGILEPVEPGAAELAALRSRSDPVAIGRPALAWRAAEHLRTGLRTACRGLPTDAAALLPALTVGDTRAVRPELTAALRDSGLSHLTAVSGANLVITGGAVGWLLARLGAGRRARALGALAAVLGFVLLARPEPSVLRAAVMAGLGLVGLWSARPGRGLPLLCASVLLLLLIDPWLSRSFGFALSVLATAGLLVLVPAWSLLWRRSPARRRWIALFVAVAVPTAATVTTAPVTALINPRLSLTTVPANLLAEPAVAPATVLGVLAAVSSVLCPPLAQLVAAAGTVATGWIVAVAGVFARVPGAPLPGTPAPGEGVHPGTGAPVAVALLLALLSAWITVLSVRAAVRVAAAEPGMLRQSAPARADSDAGRVHARGMVLVAAALTCGTVLALLPSAATRLQQAIGRPTQPWVIRQCDVGQGSATLIRSGPRRAVLVDTGPRPDLLARCLRESGVRTLDLVVLTHFHADHVGGLAGALAVTGGGFTVLTSPLARPVGQYRRVLGLSRGLVLRPVLAGARGSAGPQAQVTWRVLWPQASPAGTVADDDGAAINNAGLALQIAVQGITVALLGDLEGAAQASLRARQAVSAVDVVVVAHHGSARQDDSLYRLLRPRVALIGVGADNDYGHPARSTLIMLERLGVQVRRTDLHRTISVSGAAGQLFLHTDEPGHRA